MTADLRKALLERATYRGDKETESLIYSPLFGRDIVVMIQHEHDRTEPSDDQLEQIESFAKLHTGLDKIKRELYSQWKTVDNWGEFELANADRAFADAKLVYLLVPPRTMFDEVVCLLRFSVKWDEEHGAAIFVRDGVIGEFANY